MCYHLLVTQQTSAASAGEPADDGDARTSLFSYGTLQQREVQLANFGRALDGSPDVLPGYRLETLTITDPDVVAVSGSAEHPFAVATGDPGDEIVGTVVTLTTAELAAADRYEVDDYTRVLVELRSGGSAWAYVRPRGTDDA